MADTPKRTIMTPDRLAKLAEARKKANDVRARGAMVKKAEKEKKQQELEVKYKELVEPKLKEQPKTKEEVKEVKEVFEEPKKVSRKKKITKVIEIDSEESSSSSESEDEYDISPVKEKYRQKYKNKYAPKQQVLQPQAYNPYPDAVVLAKHNIQSKVNVELQKLAMASLFG